MVSKVAVMAMVAIVACPILLGYAMNLSETTVTDYKISDDSVNVTPLLQNDVTYTSTFADTYMINTNFSYVSSPENNPTYHPIIPIYKKMSSVYSALPMFSAGGSFSPGYSGSDSLTSFNLYYIIWDYGYNSAYTTMNIYSGSTLITTLSQVKEIYYDRSNDSITYVYGPYNTVNTISGGNYTGWQYTNSSSSVTHTVGGGQRITNNTSFVDISAGFQLGNGLNLFSDPAIDIPTNAKSILLTINLDSITDANYTMRLNVVSSLLLNNGIKLVKTTTGGVVSWQFYRGSTLVTDLYYDSNRNDNTYQISISLKDPYQYGNNQIRYDNHVELRYIGGWPDAIGEANAYVTYSYDYGAVTANTYPDISHIQSIYFDNLSNYITPTMRVDAIKIDGIQINVVSDQTYEPSAFRSNPATKLENIGIYGHAINFGGNTYTVDNDGNITLGTKKVPLDGIVLDSIPVSGGYENRINGTVISTTAQPSTITFDGNWSLSVATSSMESYSYTKTEWTPGHFAWNGIDENFLMVGLMTSIGVFIALAIYIRKTGASLWPLLLVCGGAAVLFFTML